jgi:cysteine desulfurase/selenocysteine lyase
MAGRKYDFRKLRAAFPALKRHTYVNAAAASPLPRPVFDAANELATSMMQDGDLHFDAWLAAREKTRAGVAKLLNASAREVGFTSGTSNSMNLIAQMIWESGGRRVVTLASEFPASTLPFLHRRFEVRFVEPRGGVYRIEDIAEAVDGHTSALVVSHVQYGSGFALDLDQLGALAQARHCRFVVNATQSVGARPIDVRASRIDFLAAVGHKWLCAGYGAGLFYARESLLHELRLPVAGWTSVLRPELMENRRLELRREASAVEVGCPAFDAIVRLGAAVELLSAPGTARIHEYILELTEELRDGLREIGIEPVTPDDPTSRSGITAFVTPDPAGFVKALEKRKIQASARQGAVRIALHAYNDSKDVQRVLEAVELLARRTPTRKAAGAR